MQDEFALIVGLAYARVQEAKSIVSGLGDNATSADYLRILGDREIQPEIRVIVFHLLEDRETLDTPEVYVVGMEALAYETTHRHTWISILQFLYPLNPEACARVLSIVDDETRAWWQRIRNAS